MKAKTFAEAISIVFIILFLYTAISKLTDYQVFKEQIAQSPLLSPISKIIAWALPVIEILVAMLLFLPRFRLYGLYASLSLMIIFTLYIGAIMTFSAEIPCSCGGILAGLNWAQHLFLNIVLTGLSALGILLVKRTKNMVTGSPSLT